jgi:hypothetical protein
MIPEAKLPQRWNELTLAEASILYFLLRADGIPMAVALSEAAKSILNIDDNVLKNWRDAFVNAHGLLDGEWIFAEQWAHTVKAVLKPFIEQREKSFTTKLELTKCPFPKLQVKMDSGTHNLYACADNFSNISIGEFAKIDNLCVQYVQNPTVETIDLILAIIYRPSKPNTKRNRKLKYENDRRIPMSEGQYSEKERAEQFRNIGDAVRQMIWFWVTSCREQFYQKWDNVLRSKSGEQGNKKLTQFGWAGLFIELANKQMVSKEAVASQNANSIMLELSFYEAKSASQK